MPKIIIKDQTGRVLYKKVFYNDSEDKHKV